jgi:LCP family protein required for cell wall assembly
MQPSGEIKPGYRPKLTGRGLTYALLGAFTVAALGTALLTFAIVRDVVASWESGPVPEFEANQVEALQATLPETIAAEGNLPMQTVEGPAPMPWDGERPISVLVMGLDYRDWEAGQGAPRTDTMILLSLDPSNRTAGMLSIPRDLWVKIPGFEPNRINAAYRLGQIYKVEGGGAGLAMRAVQSLLGMNVDYYALVDFAAFERFIDEIGGVKVDVPAEILVDPLGPKLPRTLQPGVQVLPGSLALAYARARSSEGGDFDRAERQQQVIMGIRNRLLDRRALPRLIRRSPFLYSTLASGVHTNLTLFQVIRLAWLARQVPEENIKRGAIGPNQATFSNAEDGQEILVPIPEEILFLRDEIFTTSGPIVPAATETDRAILIDAEDASISILNGTRTPGLAADTAQTLEEAGLTNVHPNNASAVYTQTRLIDYSGNPHTVSYLTELLQIDPSNVYSRYDVSSFYDIVILLGRDREPGAETELDQGLEEQTPVAIPTQATSPTPATFPTQATSPTPVTSPTPAASPTPGSYPPP